MMKRLVICAAAVLMLAFAGGCVSFGTDPDDGGPLKWNTRQSVARSAGDVAMTIILDEGVDRAKAREYAVALLQLLEQGTLNKGFLATEVRALAVKHDLLGIADYIDALLAVVPSDVGIEEEIPEIYREALVSFVKDGAIRATNMYREKEIGEEG